MERGAEPKRRPGHKSVAEDANREGALIIDATLPIIYPKNPSKVKELAPRWAEMAKLAGVEETKQPTDPVIVPGTLDGLDEAIFSDYLELFSNLAKENPRQVVFKNTYGCATAMAVAWLEAGGFGVVASFGGIGNLPALEETLMALHVNRKHPLPDTANPLRHLRDLYKYFSGEKISYSKPVSGQGIFAIESGIHVDGILKDASLYEPFPPQMVGCRRYLAIGLHSGLKAIRLKCDCMAIKSSPNIIKELLKKVKEQSLKQESSLTDKEFLSLYHSVNPPKHHKPKPSPGQPSEPKGAKDDQGARSQVTIH
ncbi:MAG: hypothetical protein LBU69_03020 [Deltaproteobacteria bacterium]|jgi:isopropylmalate/homocitrate/citramalate synthase|nr:hypothetical protein [Deltaproteobacteria bacterium]